MAVKRPEEFEKDIVYRSTRWLPLLIISVIVIIAVIYLQAVKVTVPESGSNSEILDRNSRLLGEQIEGSADDLLGVLISNYSASWLLDSEMLNISSVPMPNPKTVSPVITREAFDRIFAKKKKNLPRAIELVSPDGFINSENFTLNDFIGKKVILINFWSSSSINSLRTVAFLKEWNKKYKDLGLEIIGVHTPEFDFEKNLSVVEATVERLGIDYPVILDNNYFTWRAYRNRFWPAFYLIDIDGFITLEKFGEGNCHELEASILSALKERSNALHLNLSIPSKPSFSLPLTDFSRIKTPTIYLGYSKNRGDLGNNEGFLANMPVTYSIPENLVPNMVYLEGRWFNHPESMELLSGSGRLVLDYDAKDVEIVAGGNAHLSIKVDDVPVDSSDVKKGELLADDFRLYRVVEGRVYGQHHLEIDVDGPGFKLYSISFG